MRSGMAISFSRWRPMAARTNSSRSTRNPGDDDPDERASPARNALVRIWSGARSPDAHRGQRSLRAVLERRRFAPVSIGSAAGPGATLLGRSPDLSAYPRAGGRRPASVSRPRGPLDAADNDAPRVAARGLDRDHRQ